MRAIFGAIALALGVMAAFMPAQAQAPTGCWTQDAFPGLIRYQNGSGVCIPMIVNSDGSINVTSSSTPSAPTSTNITPTSSAAAGIAPGAANAANNLVLKASAGNLYDVYLTATADSWLYVFNATSAPSDGAVTAGIASGNYSQCIKVASGTTGSIAYAAIPEVYTVGITAVISSTACGTLTKATTGFLHGRAK